MSGREIIYIRAYSLMPLPQKQIISKTNEIYICRISQYSRRYRCFRSASRILLNQPRLNFHGNSALLLLDKNLTSSGQTVIVNPAELIFLLDECMGSLGTVSYNREGLVCCQICTWLAISNQLKYLLIFSLFVPFVFCQFYWCLIYYRFVFLSDRITKSKLYRLL